MNFVQGYSVPHEQRPSSQSGSSSAEVHANEYSEESAENPMHLQVSLISKNILDLAHDKNGCRMVQKAFEEVGSDETRLAIVEGLKGHVWEVMRCRHANHVLQKYIATMRPSACIFIIEELSQHGPDCICKAARHKYASRILQRLMEHLWPSQIAFLVETLLPEVEALMMHRYGNYVVQHIIEFGTAAQQQHVLEAMKHSVAELCLNNDACMVLGKAFDLVEPQMKSSLLDAILQQKGALAAMAHMRRGHTAVVCALETARPVQMLEACMQLMQQIQSLRSNRYGRIVLNAAQQRGSDEQAN